MQIKTASPGYTVPAGRLISPSGAPGATGFGSGGVGRLAFLAAIDVIPVGGTGAYCAIATLAGCACGADPSAPAVLPVRLKETLMTLFGNTGLTQVNIQAQKLDIDGVWRDFGPVLVGTGTGWMGSLTILGTHFGARWNVILPPVGGTVNAEIDTTQELAS